MDTVEKSLTSIIETLYNNPQLSDLKIKLQDGSTLFGHKLVLVARSKIWFNQYLSAKQPSSPATSPSSSSSSASPANIAQQNSVTTQETINDANSRQTDELDCSDMDTEVAASVFNWVYTNQFEYDSIFHDENYIFKIMKAARRYKLLPLIAQCEKCLLSMAPEVGLDKIARLLLEGQSNVNIKNEVGLTLLHLAIMNGDEKCAIYLMNNNADISVRTPTNQTTLELAIKHKLVQVVRCICQKDYEMKNLKCSRGDPPIWIALTNRDEDIASILVEYNCDTNFWEEVPSKYSQNLLHRALDQNDQQIACFLIRSGCDCNSPRKPLKDGEGDEEAFDGQTPLHMACNWGMEEVVRTLLEHHADINAQDSELKTPIHIAIINQEHAITNLLVEQQQLDLRLRDKYGHNAFATAMSTKNNKAATIILGREPHAAEKYDPKGRTFLHSAILKNDIESVLFLLSVHVNIHSRVQDSSKFTPLHLAVQEGSEMIVRNLLLAGANVNDVTVQNQTALHVAAAYDRHHICQILIENNVNYDAVDADLNNALHLACQNGKLNSCRILLIESQISAEALNLRGQNPVHLLAQHGKENAAAIFDIFIQAIPEYPINAQDATGSTALLLAYRNGNANLCRALIRHKACLGSTDKNGINIFNAQVASKNLLYRLLDYLPQEPPWVEGDSCQECQTKFGITNRKHHCRHCGRILCAKCSSREVTILKFKSNKPERVCGICGEVLTYGETHTS